MATAKSRSVDAYLAKLPAERRAVLERLRAQIHKALPSAEEIISYQIPAVRVEGGIVAGFLVRAKGYSYVPFSGTTLATLADDLRDYKQTKSSLHFTDAGLPAALVKKLVRARLGELGVGRVTTGSRRRPAGSRRSAGSTR